jgi:hypothetical protein
LDLFLVSRGRPCLLLLLLGRRSTGLGLGAKVLLLVGRLFVRRFLFFFTLDLALVLVVTPFPGLIFIFRVLILLASGSDRGVW